MNREVMQRVCARVLPVNAAGEVLLLHGWDPAALVEVGREDVAFDWGEWYLVQDQTYFALRLDVAAADVHFGGLEPLEVGSIDDARWWTADALEAAGTAVSETLLTMMRAAVAAVLR
jgi:hypothetical protein